MLELPPAHTHTRTHAAWRSFHFLLRFTSSSDLPYSFTAKVFRPLESFSGQMFVSSLLQCSLDKKRPKVLGGKLPS